MLHTLALMLFLITFVAAIHAHLAPIWTHVALHALHSRLARAQTRHLLTIIPDWARSVAVACCRGKVGKKNERDWWGKKKASQLATTAGREIGVARFIVCTNCAWSNLSLCSVVLERHLCLKYQGLVIVQPALGATGGGQEGGEWIRKRNSGKQHRGRTSSPLCSWNQWRVLFSTPLLLNVVLACGVLSACFG